MFWFFFLLGSFGHAGDFVLPDRFRDMESVTFGQPDTQNADQNVDAYSGSKASPYAESGYEKKTAEQRPCCTSDCIDPIQPPGAYAYMPQVFHIKPAQYRQGDTHQCCRY